jgi:hypothetical protein
MQNFSERLETAQANSAMEKQKSDKEKARAENIAKHTESRCPCQSRKIQGCMDGTAKSR